MATSRPLRLAPEWDDRFTRMVGLSALGHALVLVAVVLLVGRLGGRPLPMVAYTVELTDPSALGGRLPPRKRISRVGLRRRCPRRRRRRPSPPSRRSHPSPRRSRSRPRRPRS